MSGICSAHQHHEPGCRAPLRPIKLIFLDIDGVLVNRASLLRRPREFDHSNCDPACVAALNRIIAETGGHIVVSSVWRGFGPVVYLREIINGHFGVVGKIIGKTPRLLVPTEIKGIDGKVEMSAERGDEIADWLLTYQRDHIESFVILDDDSDMGALSDRLVQTQFEAGLTEADADRAITMLNAKVEATL